MTSFLSLKFSGANVREQHSSTFIDVTFDLVVNRDGGTTIAPISVETFMRSGEDDVYEALPSKVAEAREFLSLRLRQVADELLLP